MDKKTVKTLQDQHELLQNRIQATMQIIPGSCWYKDLHGVYLDCNEQMAKELGFANKQDIIGRSDHQLPWGDYAEQLIQNDQEVITSGVLQRGKEEYVKTSDGTAKTFIVAKAPLYDINGVCIGTVGNSIDITEQKKLEKALREAKQQAESAYKAKTDFIANISHDLRTPLLGIIGLSEKLSHHNAKIDDYHVDLHTIHQSSQALHDLLLQVIELIEAEHYQPPPQRVNFSLDDIIQQSTDVLKATMADKGLNMSVQMDDNLPKHLIGDPMPLQRILLNLLSNAVKFTKKGSVCLQVNMQQQKSEYCVLQFIIEDTGIGIPQDHLSTIFERFNRLHPAYEGIYSGFGLGLYIVKQLVEQLQGDLHVESTLNKGSRFTVTLSFAVPNQPLQLQTDATQTRIIEQGDDNDEVLPYSPTKNNEDYHYQILLVEDHPTLAKIMRHELERLGCTVTTANNGQMALDYIEHNSYDCIFMDIGLPDMDGLQITQAIRQLTDNPNCNIPIVAQTAHFGTAKREQMLQAGMNELIAKPLTAKKARAALDYFLRDQKQAFLYFREITADTVSNADYNTLKIFDIAHAAQRIGFSMTQAKQLMEKLALLLPDDIKAINEAYHAHNLEQTCAQCHRLRGALCYVTTPRLEMALIAFHHCVRKQGFNEKTKTLYKRLTQEAELFITTFHKKHC